jgi:hypothetical protein
MPIREVITDAINQLNVVLENYEEIAAATESISEIKASLVNVKAAHEKAYAELVEEQRLLDEARANHKRDMATMETSFKVAQSKVFKLIEEAKAKEAEIQGLRQYHDELLASIESLKKRLHAA